MIPEDFAYVISIVGRVGGLLMVRCSARVSNMWWLIIYWQRRRRKIEFTHMRG